MYMPKGERRDRRVLEAAFLAAVAGEPIDAKLREAREEGQARAQPGSDIALLAAGLITPTSSRNGRSKEALRKQVIKVDDFAQDFGRAELVVDAKAHVAAKAA